MNGKLIVSKLNMSYLMSITFDLPLNTKNGFFCLYFSSSTEIRIHLYENLRMKTVRLFLKTKTGGFKVKYAKEGGT